MAAQQACGKAAAWLKHFVLERPLEVDAPDVHRKFWLRTWVAAVLYSLVYGQYEYWVVYNGPRLLDDLGEQANWSIMYAGIALLAALVSKGRIAEVVFAVIFMAMLEDVSFWIALWIDKDRYPFPAGDWWDLWFSSFRALGYLGKDIGFWPWVPRYYIPGFGLRIGFDVASFLGPQQARFWTMFGAPLFFGLLIGTSTKPPCKALDETCGPDYDTLAMIIAIIVLSWTYAVAVLVRKHGWPTAPQIRGFFCRRERLVNATIADSGPAADSSAGAPISAKVASLAV